MTRRDSIVLSGHYANAFIASAIENGYVIDARKKHEEKSAPFSIVMEGTYNRERDSLDLHFCQWIWDWEIYRPLKQDVLQMFLLYDKVVLLNTIPSLDYTPLINTGRVEVVTATDDEYLSGDMRIDHVMENYALFLKPLVIRCLLTAIVEENSYFQDEIEETLAINRRYLPKVYDLFTCEDIYSYLLKNEKHMPDLLKFMGSRRKSLHRSGRRVRDASEVEKIIYSDSNLNMNLRRIRSSLGALISLLDLSLTTNAALMQNEYDIQASKLARKVGLSRIRTIEAYKILKLSLSKTINQLPAPLDIKEVLQMKERRQSDIARLRHVLAELENSLRSGRAQALLKAERQIRLASSDLARGNRLAKVAKWATYISVPISIVESLCSLPPLMSLSIGTLGAGVTLEANICDKVNNWVEIVR